MDTKLLARIGALVFVAIAIEATRKDGPKETWSPSRPNVAHVDPLRAELLRCQALGEGGPHDRACLRAWAENRNRFLAPGARPEERLSVTQPAAPPPPTPASLPEAQ